MGTLVLHGGKGSLMLLAGGFSATGLSVMIIGIIQSDLPRAAGGVCLIFPGLTFLALALLHTWITDTSRERDRQDHATSALADEKTKYIAAQAALELERNRVQRDAEAQRQRNAAQLRVEREALHAQFEERRAQLVCETMETTVRMIRAKLFDEPKQTSGRVVRFPRVPAPEPGTPAPQQATERSREHGVVGP